jgi:RNA polymerase sigma-70 factor (ECF subfamily)
MARSNNEHRGDEDQVAARSVAEAVTTGATPPRISGIRVRAQGKPSTRAEALDALEAREPCRRIEDLWNRYKPAIWARLSRPTIPEDVAEDLLVEVFVTMNQQLKDQGGVPPVPGRTLNAITTHAICNYVRTKKHEPIFAPSEALEMEALPSSRSNPERAFDRARRAQFVRKILDLMADEERQLVDLVYFCDISEADVAEALGIPAGTVRYRVHQARAHFKTLALRHRGEPGGDV